MRGSRVALVAVAAIGVAALTTALLRGARTPMSALIDAAPRDARSVEPRLSAFPWARLQTPTRGDVAPTPADLKFAGAAGAVLDDAARDTHATGVAYLMLGRTGESIATLERAAPASNDAAVWNDLAAAHYVLAATGERASHLPLALAAAKRAITLAPSSAAAHFNRALIIEQLGLNAQARDAWHRYLAIEPSSDWSNEARAHLRSLGERDVAFDFRRALQSASNDPVALAALARAHPEDARRWGEGPLLKEWADAETAHDAPRAAAQLAIVRALANAITDDLLRDAVTAIERADANRGELAVAHQLYDEGRAAYRNRDARAAEPTLRRAAELFRRGKSPMADVAAYFAANAVFDASGSDSELANLHTRVDRTRHRALAAQLQWQTALVANMRGDWVTAAREAGAGAATFHALGEEANAGNLDAMAAHALEVLGDREAAWAHRIRALASVPPQGGRQAGMLHSAALALASTGNTAAAEAVLDLITSDLRGGDPVLFAETLALRARFAAQSGDAAAAQRWLVEARGTATTLGDPSVREATLARIDVAEAALRTKTAPAEAVVLATKALDACRARGIGNLVPEALLQRARAFAAQGDEDAAAADYDVALQTIEGERRTIADDQRRLAFLDTAAQVIEDAVDLHVSRGRVARALAIADRARALNETTATPIAVAEGTAVVEYVALPQSLLVFETTTRGLRAVRIVTDRATLGSRVAALADAIRRRAPIETIRVEAAALHRLLMAPLRLDGIDELVIVPDRELFALPFATLYDETRQHYLAQDVTLRFAPSASEAAASDAGALAPATVIADPPSARWPSLAHAREEAERIAALHGASMLMGEAATRAAFVDAAQRSALLHFAGHADTDAAESYGALVLAPDAGDAGALGSNDIARLQLPLRPLVVLAACGTFRGDPMHVGGMSSLARSFLAAGARAVVGTLWEIDDDAAAPLFRQFHEHLHAGAPPAQALRSAQLDMLRSSDPRLRHPATWAVASCLAVHRSTKEKP